jgi:hypothetical protein
MKARKNEPELKKVKRVKIEKNPDNIKKFQLKILDDYNIGIECNCGRQFYPYFRQGGRRIPDKLCWSCAVCNTSKELIINK